MRIGIDIRALQEGRTTGVQVYIKNLLSALFEIDRHNHYLLFGNAYRDISAYLPKFDYPNVEYRLFKYPNKFFMTAQKFVGFPKVDRLLGGIDLFFSPHWRQTALDSNIPLIITFHDLSFEILPEFFTLWQRIWHLLMGYKKAARLASRIIAVSASTARDLREMYNLPKDKIEIVYSGIKTPGIVLRSGFDNQYFLTLATFEPRKNLQGVISAYGQYVKKAGTPKHLVIAGSRGWKSRLKIPDHLKNLITVKNDVSEAEKANLYSNAFAFVFPSFYEGYGFPVLEAASFGVPIIAGANTSQAEIAGSFALLINPLRVSQISAAMRAIEQDRELYDKMRNRGLEEAAKYTWEASARAVLKIFNSTV